MAVDVTKKQAEKVFAQVKKRFRGYWTEGLDSYGDAPKLVKDWQWSSTVAPYAIIWESGPYEWVHQIQVDVEGVFAEPYTGWALGIYKA
jgi:hypothetical protein